MTMQSNLHSEPAGAPLRARVGAVAQAARALLSGVLRRPQPGAVAAAVAEVTT